MSKEKLRILVLAGTTREQRKSIHAAKFVKEIGETYEDVEIDFVDPKDLVLPGDGNDPEGKDPKYTEKTEKADAFFIITPEYNHSFPGSLKRMLDSELSNYIHKPVAIAGVSAGMWGGIRAVQSLIPVVRELGMAVTFTDVYFTSSYTLFTDDGSIAEDRSELYTKSTRKAFDELIWMAKTLKHGRDNIK
ncbi:MAG: NAD(P)H-dependent FMN reductase [Candidatus Saccharimonadales bacterium]|jgi:NAD(P)H-dependent FMN reductase